MNPEIIHFKEIKDDRGGLIALEQMKNIPFEIKRVYFIYNTPKKIRRGFHAHKALEQVAVCVKGACSFLLDNGKSKCEVRVDTPDKGLYIGNMVWREMYDFSDDCVLMVIASDIYNEDDYIRKYDQFLEIVK